MNDSEPTEPPESTDRADDAEATPGAEHGTPVTQQLGRVVLVLVAVLFVVFALANAQPVDFSWVVGETAVVERGGEPTSGGVPLIILLVASFVAGATVASLLGWQRHRRSRPRR